MIDIKDIIMDFRIQNENISSMKEYVVNAMKRKITYKTFRALDKITFHIDRGEVCGIIGSNGAGKSTLLKIIAGVLSPTSGAVQVRGNIAPMLELGAGFDYELTARENIFLNGAILGYSKEFLLERYEEIVAFSGLHEFIDRPIRTFSSGMMMRIAFSIATVVEPEILIVDEILSVGDANFAKKSADRMQQMMEGGTTVLMVSHVMKQIRELCDRVIWLDKGQIVMDDLPNKVCDAYMNATQ